MRLFGYQHCINGNVRDDRLVCTSFAIQSPTRTWPQPIATGYFQNVGYWDFDWAFGRGTGEWLATGYVLFLAPDRGSLTTLVGGRQRNRGGTLSCRWAARGPQHKSENGDQIRGTVAFGNIA